MTPTRAALANIEDSGYQFLSDEAGWVLYDDNDRSEVKGTRAKALGDAIWQAVAVLGIE